MSVFEAIMSAVIAVIGVDGRSEGDEEYILVRMSARGV